MELTLSDWRPTTGALKAEDPTLKVIGVALFLKSMFLLKKFQNFGNTLSMYVKMVSWQKR